MLYQAVAPPIPAETAKAAHALPVSENGTQAKVDKKRKALAQEVFSANAKKSKKASQVRGAYTVMTRRLEVLTVHEDVETIDTRSSQKIQASKLAPPDRASSKKEAEGSSSDDGQVTSMNPPQQPPIYSESDSASEDELDPSKLVHESVASGSKSKTGSGKTKYVPPEETQEQRDARTVFVGNVPVEVVKSRVRLFAKLQLLSC